MDTNPGKSTASEVPLESYAGQRVVPKYAVIRDSARNVVVWLAATPESTLAAPVSALLYAAMEKQQDDHDFPATVRRLAAVEGFTDEQVHHMIVSALGLLVRSGLVHLEELPKRRGLQWTGVPR